jgi:hypothetical protein
MFIQALCSSPAAIKKKGRNPLLEKQGNSTVG